MVNEPSEFELLRFDYILHYDENQGDILRPPHGI